MNDIYIVDFGLKQKVHFGAKGVDDEASFMDIY